MVFLLTLGMAALLVAGLVAARGFANPMVNVADELRTAQPYVEVDREVALLLGNARGYDLQMAVPGTYTLSYRRTPGWAIVLAVLTFPIGLLVVFLARETLSLTVSVTAAEAGARIVVVGRAHAKVATTLGETLQRLFVSPAPVRRG